MVLYVGSHQKLKKQIGLDCLEWIELGFKKKCNICIFFLNFTKCNSYIILLCIQKKKKIYLDIFNIFI